MSWRNSKATARLREQINEKWPTRAKASDGTIGDAAHAARTSDHNPNSAGVVCAVDITKDGVRGPDLVKLINNIAHDPRLHYAIHNRQIRHAGGPWVAYHGSSPHDKHAHFSVHQSARLYDDGRDWDINVVRPPAEKPKPAKKRLLPAWLRPVLRIGSRDSAKNHWVSYLQARLIAHGFGLKPDGIFGPYTEDRVEEFQKAHGLVRDGIVGRKTWKKLG